MNCTGKILNITKNWQSDQYQITFEINEKSINSELDAIKDCELLSIEAKKYRKKRSLDANGLLWHCLGEIASAMQPPEDKWNIYLQMLKRYGKYTYICVKPNAVDAMKAQWRECEVVGEVDINGQKAVQMLCYYGSSLLDTKEFSVLLDGVISEMKEMGIELPVSNETRALLESMRIV